MTDNPRAATQDEIDKARAAAEAAAAKLAKLQAAQDEKTAQEAAQRAERELEYARSFHAGWRQRASDGVHAAGTSTVAYDPETMGFLEGLIRMGVGRENRRAVLEAAQRAESIMGISSAQSNVPESRYYSPDIAEHINRIIGAEVTRRNAEFRDALDAEREKFVSGEA
ncbi:hypothetical protein ACFWSF_00400 [Streptomyces sp. NPDC058611]|uniref:hypothetical protein n=1 Tax=unclassified Streptomyces TaxID=2593676 RepID=UPI00366021C7